MQTEHSLMKIIGAGSVIALVVLTLLFQRFTTSVVAQSPTTMKGVKVSAAQAGSVNVRDLARQEELNPSAPESAQGAVIPYNAQVEPNAPSNAPAQSSPLAPLAPSISPPVPSFSYQGLDDIASGIYYYIPPDTMGAVGLTRTLDTLNNNYRVQEKYTGATVSTVTMNNFWKSTSATGLFDPKALYDPYNNRFILAAAANSASITSSLEVGVSNGTDPNGAFTLYRVLVCDVSFPCGPGTTDWWADYPSLGFNKNWVVVTTNMFSNSADTFQESRVLALDYPLLRTGTFSGTIFIGIPDFTVQPCVTYSSTENTLYAPNHNGSASATYRLNTLTGTPDFPVYSQGALKTHTLAPMSGGSTPPPANTNVLPQLQGTAGITDVAKIDAGDSRILRCSFRNGNIWYAQTVYLPAGGSWTHTAAQWVRLDTSGNDVDGGRVEDPTATATNGGKWYSYPTLAVNQFNDVLMGFTQFASNQWPSAGYTYRAGTAPAGTMSNPYTYKAGGGMYWKTFDCTHSTARNRWGDYSTTQVDPVDDRALWTLQEYSKPEGSPFAANGCNSGVWSTWWARVSPQRLFLPLITRP